MQTGEFTNTLKGRNGGECANRMEARLGARPLGAPAQGGVSGVVALATRRAAGRGSVGRVGPHGDSAAPLKPPRCFPLRFAPLGVFEFEGGIRKGGFPRGEN